MKWNRSSKLLRLLALALLTAYINPGVASAQEAAGKFTLPFEAHWGLATLPAGEYSFNLDRTGVGVTLQLFHGTKTVAFVINQSYSDTQSGACALTVVRNSAGNTVRDLSLPELGVVLHYAPPKPKSRAAAGEREIAQVIPVTATQRGR
ncbi:MAG TPA: hypothetical protein VI455_06645 [Terriglobia bacterium]